MYVADLLRSATQRASARAAPVARRWLLHKATLTLVGLLAIYALVGYVGVPSIVRSQLIKQVQAQLGHEVRIEQVRFDPFAFVLEVDGLTLADPQGRPLIGWRHLAVDAALWRSLLDWAWTLASIELEAPQLDFELDADGRHSNFSALMDRLGSGETNSAPAPLPRFAVRRVSLTEGRLSLADRALAEPVIAEIRPIELEVDGLSSFAATPARYRLKAPTASDESFESSGEFVLGASSAKGRVAVERLATKTLARALSRVVVIEVPAGGIDASAQFELAVEAEGRIDATIRELALGAKGLSLAMPGDDRAAAFNARGDVSVNVETVTLESAPGSLNASAKGLRGTLGEFRVARGPDRLSLGQAALTVGALSAGFGQKPPDALQAGVDLQLTETSIRLGALEFAAPGATPVLGQAGAVDLSAGALRIGLGGSAVDVTADGLGAALSDAVLRGPEDPTELLRLGRVTLAGGALRLGEREFLADTLTISQGDARTWRDGQGRFNWAELFGTPKTAAPEGAAPSAPTPRWHVAVKQTQVEDFVIGFEDRRETPPLALEIRPLGLRISALDTAAASPMQIAGQATLASGGTLHVEGGVHLDSGASDLKLRLEGLALAPGQRLLARYADLRLASGTVSGQGRFRYGDAAAPARLRYEGRVALDRLLLEELDPRRPFLSWDSVATDDLVATLGPDRLDIGVLRVDRPAGRLIIAEDQTMNITDVLKKPAPGAGAAKAAPKAADAKPFPVRIGRVRVADGALEFADLSLRPQFGTRMHDLKGVITGLGTDPQGRAEVHLDARVDQYGDARIRGQTSLSQPARKTDIDMRFRNLELTSLSPYVVKFAGYRLASGQLDLDLNYRVENSKLLGENHIVLNQMVLGERVESPSALDLPLELAVAILKDSKGVIDLGLPIRGDLADPTFDYGAIIGKAIGNLLVNIVTAPFKALGALFGSGDQTLSTIDFEPGSDELVPPERQKLAELARALKERPALTLVVPAMYSTASDLPALKSFAVRQDVVKAMGIALAEGEDPGPIDFTDDRAQRAIEGLFSERFGPEVLAALKRRAIESAPPAAASAPSAASAASAPSAASTAAPPVARPAPAFFRQLADRLIKEHAVPESALAALGVRRAKAVIEELVARQGLPPARSQQGPANPEAAPAGETVALQLELQAAR